MTAARVAVDGSGVCVPKQWVDWRAVDCQHVHPSLGKGGPACHSCGVVA